MNDQTRHEQLLGAGWSYDPDADRYLAPGSPDDGTAPRYNLEAAWQRFRANQQGGANTAQQTPPNSRVRSTDPRVKEPE